MSFGGGGGFGGPGDAAAGAGVLISDLLRSSFRCIGSLRVGFGYSPSELVDGLFVLNAMLDSWSADDMNAYYTLIAAYDLVAGQKLYTIGSGGDWDGPRPTSVSKAVLVVLTNPDQPLRLDLDLVNADQYQGINLQDTQSTLPTTLFYNPNYPLGEVSLWPVPSDANQVELSSMQLLAGNITDETATFSVPPGYLDAVRYNLAVRLAMEWDKPLKEGVDRLAMSSLATIQRNNAPTPQMDVNGGVFPARTGRGNWSRLTGD